MDITEGMRIQFPQWDESDGPTLIVKHVDGAFVTTMSERTRAVVQYPLANVIRLAKVVNWPPRADCYGCLGSGTLQGFGSKPGTPCPCRFSNPEGP